MPATRIATATSDRPGPHWDPNVTGKLDNADGSPVALELEAPGLYRIEFGGYVKGEGHQEVNVMVAPLDAADPFEGQTGAKTSAIGTVVSDSGSDHWLSASAVIEVSAPVRVVAYVYSNTGEAQVRVATNPASPYLTACLL